MYAPAFALLWLASIAASAVATKPDVAAIFKNPVMSRVYQQRDYCLAGADKWENNNVSIAEVATSLAALKPTYVSGTIRLAYNETLTQPMVCIMMYGTRLLLASILTPLHQRIDNFKTIRDAVLEQSQDAKFDVELNLDPNDPGKGYPSGEAAVAQMTQLNEQLPIDGWWFDYLSTAQANASSWVVQVRNYAQSQNQTIGGNIFGTDNVPDGMDAIAFVDGKDPSNKQFGYGIQSTKVEALQKAAKGSLVLGHLNNNPQTNIDTTESCVYMRNWTSTERADYLNYWVKESQQLNVTYMLPLFFPQCPGIIAYSPLKDTIEATNETVYTRIKNVALSRMA